MKIDIKEALEGIAKANGIQYYKIAGPSRVPRLSLIRLAVYYILRTEFDMTYEAISKAVGCRAHGSAIRGFRRASDLVSINDREFMEILLASKLGAGIDVSQLCGTVDE